MSLNKTRKRLIRKYRKLYNSHPIGLKFSTELYLFTIRSSLALWPDLV